MNKYDSAYLYTELVIAVDACYSKIWILLYNTTPSFNDISFLLATKNR